MTAIPPPLRAWSKKSSNRCIFEKIPAYWMENDVITFLADTGMYDISLYHNLDAAEKEQHRKFKSEYFKKRFVVSRSILRQILHHMLGTENNADTILMQEKNGRISVRDWQDIFISLSYSGSCIALTVGKRKIGSDIERVRPMESGKIRSSPLFDGLASGNRKGDQHLLQIWTHLEAYAKFHDMSLYPLTPERFFLPDTHFVSYLIDRRFVLSLVADAKPMKDTLLWMDPSCRLTSSSTGKKAACLPPAPDGAPYVRA
jgi:4'-phosphopantetheinyl transferase